MAFLDSLVLEPLGRALHGDLRMSDWPVYLFAGSLGSLLWALGRRARNAAERKARIPPAPPVAAIPEVKPPPAFRVWPSEPPRLRGAVMPGERGYYVECHVSYNALRPMRADSLELEWRAAGRMQSIRPLPPVEPSNPLDGHVVDSRGVSHPVTFPIAPPDVTGEGRLVVIAGAQRWESEWFRPFVDAR